MKFNESIIRQHMGELCIFKALRIYRKLIENLPPFGF